MSNSKAGSAVNVNSSKTNLKKSISSTVSKGSLGGGSRMQSSKNLKSLANLQEGAVSSSFQPNILSAAVSAVFPSTSYYHDKELTGIYPLFLTSQSQGLMKATIDKDLTPAKMFRMIPKSDLIQDMATRLAISDFTPAKAFILAYPRDELMLHYDPEYKYTQNFFLVVDAATVDMIMAVRDNTDIKPPVQAVESLETLHQDGTVLVGGKRVREKGWRSFGSEREIEMEWVKDIGPPVSVEVSRKLGEYNAPYTFGDRDAQDGFLEIKSYKDPNYDTTRVEIHVGVQAVPCLNESSSQTAWFRPVNFSCQYEALEMNVAEQEEIQRSAALEEFFLTISPRFEEFLQQNEIMDIFRNDYQLLGEEEMALEQGSHAVLQEYQSFTDLANSKDKCISCIDWHPVQKGVLAISCTQALGYDDRITHGFTVKSKKSVILIWSFHDPIHPQLILEAPEDVSCFQIHPQDPSIIVAGCINGQLVLWDITEYQEKLQSSRKADKDSAEDKGEHLNAPTVLFAIVSSIESSHRGPVTDLHWLPKNFEISSNGEVLENGENGDKQLVTSSLDGTIAFWDLRFKKDWKSLDLAWRPFIRVPITSMDNSFDYSVTRVNLRTVFSEEALTKAVKQTPALTSNPEIGEPAKPKASVKAWSSKFYCATEEGDVVYADWISEKLLEWNLPQGATLAQYVISSGHPSSLTFSYQLVAGPFTFGGKKQLSQMISNVTCAKWSPSRPGVFYIGRADGNLEVWDLMDRSHAAGTVQSVATSAISSINIKQYPGKSAQQFIAVGDDSGTLHILETPRNLQKVIKNEKIVISALFDRESRRLDSASERKKVHSKGRAAFEASLLEQTTAAAKLAQAITYEVDGDKIVENAEDIEALNEEKRFKQMESMFMDSLIALAAE